MVDNFAFLFGFILWGSFQVELFPEWSDWETIEKIHINR